MRVYLNIHIFGTHPHICIYIFLYHKYIFEFTVLEIIMHTFVRCKSFLTCASGIPRSLNLSSWNSHHIIAIPIHSKDWIFGKVPNFGQTIWVAMALAFSGAGGHWWRQCTFVASTARNCWHEGGSPNVVSTLKCPLSRIPHLWSLNKIHKDHLGLTKWFLRSRDCLGLPCDLQNCFMWNCYKHCYTRQKKINHHSQLGIALFISIL